MSDMLEQLGRTEQEAEFDDVWAAKFAGPAEDTQPDTTEEVPAEADTTETEDGQPRDELGRFTRVDQPTVDEHTRETELEAEEQAAAQAAEPDDELEQYLAKYGGDVKAALKGAVEAQKLIGRRDEEKDDLRARLEALEARQQTTPQSQPTFQRPITEADVERFDNMAYSGQGMEAFKEATALDPTGVLAKRVFETWSSVAPQEAMIFAADQIAEAKLAPLRAELEQTRAASTQSEADRQFEQAWNTLKGSRPDLDQLAPAMTDIIAEQGEGFARLIVESDPQTQVKLLGTLADAAQARQQPHVQESIAQFEAERAEASRTAKTAAAVVAPGAVGSRPGGGSGEAEKSPAQKEADRIRAGVLESSDTSISSGWTTE